MSSPAPLPDRPKFRPWTAVKAAFAFLFGRLSLKYQWPWWIHPGLTGLGKLAGRGLVSWVRVTRGPWWVRTLKASTLVLAAAALGLAAFVTFQDRRDWTALEVEAPQPTPLEKDATFSLLRLKFSDSAARADAADQSVGEGITVEPAVKGGWKWEGDDTLLFSPSEDWACDTAYRVTLDPKLFRPDLKMGSFTAEFRTEPFTADLRDLRFAVDPQNPQDRRLWGTVKFNYPVDPKSLAGQIELTVKDGGSLGGLKTLPVEVTFDEFQGKAFLKTDRLPVPTDAVAVEVKVKGGIQTRAGGRRLGGELAEAVRVPGLYDRVAYTGVEAAVVRSETYEYQQTFTLSLSGEALPAKIGPAAKLWLLPKDRVGAAGLQDEKDHRWGAQEVDAKLLAKSEALVLELLPSANDTAEAFSFRYKAPAGRMVYAEFAPKVEAFGGYIIKQGYRTTFAVPPIPKSLEIMHQGSLLSLNGDKTISVVSNDVATVRFRASRLYPDQVNHLITQTSGTFAQPYFRDSYLFSELDMSTVYDEVRDLPVKAPGAVQYQAFHFGPYLGRTANPQEKYGLFLFNVSEYDRDEKQEVGESSRRFILITDLGLLAKRAADGSCEVYVQDIRTGKPRAGALVEVLGRNGAAVFSGTSNAQGAVHVPTLADFTLEKQPVVFTVHDGNDMSFLPVDREDRFVDFTRFDVGGVTGAADPETVTAYLFSDRGLYRPGDLIHLGYIAKAGDWGRSLAGLPLELKVFDPRGVEVQKTLIKLNAAGFDQAEYRTYETSATGRWRFELAQVRDDEERVYLGSTTVRVEEFTPDRMTIGARIEGAGDRAWLPFSSLKAAVHLANLYGTPAAGNPVNASFRLVPQALTFSQYPDWRFDDAFTTEKFHEETLPSTTTDAQGDAALNLELTKFEPATFRVELAVEGLEKQGGRGVAAETTVIVSPRDWIVGWKTDGRLDYIPKGMVREVKFLGIDPLQKPRAVTGLKYAVDEVRFLSVLTKKEDGSYQYESVSKKVRAAEGDFALPAAGRSWPLDSSSPGDFELSVLDQENRVVSKVAYSIIGKGNLARTLDRNAELQIKLDKADYNVGDEIELQIKAPYAGSGLITIEREKVFATQWFTTDTNASLQHIQVPADLEGTAYVNVSFIRASDSPEIYMSPLSTGVVPFRVSLSRRTVGVSLTAPAEAKSGQPFTMSYKTDRPAKIVVFAVDEGILQVARYKTPDPLAYFFKKRALEVSTSQILDLILPEYSLVRDLMAMGGDADGLASRQNPFKRKNHAPVAFWSGIVDAGPTEKSVTYQVPSYFNGTIRVMAVAVAADAIGTAEKKSLVRNDFLISPSLPTFVAPGDEFLMGVTVANNAPAGTPGPILLKIEGRNGLTVVGAAQQSLAIDRNTEATRWFKLKAGGTPGAAQVRFTASAGGLASELVEELSIRPAVAYESVLDSGVLKGGDLNRDLPRSLVPAYSKRELTLSFRPSAVSAGLLGYLADYPYGCTEQLLSQAFPSLMLRDDPTAGLDRTKVDQSVAEAIKVLGARQNDEGGIGLWSASSEADDFVTAYAAHFLAEAAARGITAGEPVRQGALAYLKQRFSGDDAGVDQRPQVAAYAAWVLALGGEVSTNLVLDVRRSLEKKGGDGKKDPAVLFLAGASALLKQQAEADRLLADYGEGRRPGENDDDYDSELYRMALRVTMNAKYRSANPLAESSAAVDALVARIGDNGFSTLSSAWSVLAFQAYGARAPLLSPGAVQVVGVTKTGTKRPLSMPAGALGRITLDPEVVALKVTNQGGAPLYWQTVQSGFDQGLPTKAEAAGLEVYREYQDAAGKAVQSAARGQTLTAVVKIRSAVNRPVGSVAIVDLLPGGFEMVPEAPQGSFVLTNAEPREDRMIVYGEAGTSLTELRYPVKAVTAGTFVLPVTTAEAMYDRKIRARTAGGTFTVTE